MTANINARQVVRSLIVVCLLSASLSLAQSPPPAKISAALFETVSVPVPASETQVRMRQFSINLPTLDSKLLQARSPSRFFVSPSFGQLVSEYSTASSRLHAQKMQSQAASRDWIKLPTANLSEPANRADDIEFYGNLIPVAGPVILRVAREADAHPRLTRIIKYIQPEF
jgi:hypothetical protein